MSKSRARLLAELLNASGRVKKDKSDLAGADSIIDLDTLPTITNAKLENSSISIADHTVSLGGSVSLNTGDITEHTDYKYYTDARVRAAISVDGSLSYNSTTGVLSYTTPTTIASLSNHDTDDLAEGTNLYFTNARARGAISVSGDLAYNSTTGVVSFTERTDAEVRGLVSAGGNLSYNSTTGVFSYTTPTTIASLSNHDTDDLAEGTNLYFTNARARSAISASGSLSYNSSTGVLSYTQPTNISTFTNDSGYLTSYTETNDLSSAVTWTNVPNANITESSVTQHQAALTITESQISDLQNYLTSHQSLAAYATLASPALTGTPTAPTASAGTNTTQIATTAFVGAAVSNLVDSAPGTLNTLNELAAALGDDANFSTTVTNSIATKLPLAGGTVTGNLYSTSTASNAIHTRFIAGAANGSTADGPLYLQYGKSQDIRMFEASGANRKLYIYGNDNGTDRWGGLSIASDGSFTVQASDTYLILQASSYIQSNNPHNFTSSLLTSGTVWLDSSRNATFANLTATGSTSLGNISSNGITVASGHNVHLTNGNVTIGDYGNTNTGTLFLRGSTANKQAALKATNGNLHIDSNAGNNTYINYYTGSGVYFGTGAGGVAAVIGPDGDLWKGSADNSGSKYWHAGNDGSGSGLDADYLDGIQGSQLLRSDAGDTATGSIIFSGATQYFRKNDATNYTNGSLMVESYGGSSSIAAMGFHISGQLGRMLSMNSAGTLNWEDDISISGSFFTPNTSANGLKSANGNNFFLPLDAYNNMHIRSTTGSEYHDSTAYYFRKVDQSNLVTITASNTNIAAGTLTRGGNTVWDAGNDGSGSGLDADYLDGVQGSQFLRSDAADTATGPLTFQAAILSQGHSSGDNWLPYSDGNFYIRAPNTHFDANVEFNDEARVVTGSIAESNSTKGLMFDGNYQTGQYRHRFRKRDLGAGIPLFIDYAHGTANSYSAVASFGGSGSNYNEFTVYGDQDVQGQLIIDNNIASPANYYNGLQIEVRATSGTAGIGLHRNGYSHVGIYTDTTNRLDFDFNSGDVVMHYNAGTLWGSGNDGSGSGLDADTLDGVNSTSFARSDAGTTYSNYGNLQRFYSNTNLATASGSQSSLECFSNGSGNDAFMTFHVGGDYALYFGLDGGTNDLAVGGWSKGANSFKVWHAANDGASSGLDADLLDGLHGSSYWQKSGSWYGDLGSNGYDRVQGVNYTGGEFVLVEKNAQMSTLIDGDYFAYESGGFFSSSSSAYGDLSGFKAYNTNTIQVQQKDGGNANLRVTGSITRAGNTVWDSGNDGAGSGLDADTVDGYQYTNHEGVGDYQVFLVNGDTDKYYPVVITGGAGHSSDFKIWRGYNEYGPDDWNSSTHKGGLTFRYRISGSSGWGGYPNRIKVLEAEEIYTTLLGGINYTAHTMKHVVWLRGGGTNGARYHISSTSDFSLAIYTDTSSGYTSGSGWLSYDSSNNSYDTYVNYRTLTERNNSMEGEVYNTMPVTYGTGQVRHVLGGTGPAKTYWSTSNDGSGSGLDADLLDGQQGSHYLNYNNLTNRPTIPTNNNQLTNGSGYQTTSGNVRTLNSYQGSADSNSLQYWQASGQNSNYAPDGSWYNTIRGGHGNPQTYYSNTLAMKMTGSGVGTIYTQALSNGTFQGWNKYWHNNNDGSGSGLDADTLDGLNSTRFSRYGQIYNSSTDWNTIFSNTGQYNQVWHEIHNGTSWTNAPGTGAYSYGGLFNLYLSSMQFQWYVPHTASSNNGMWYRTNWGGNSWYSWKRIWDSGNDGSGSGLDADTLDGVQGSNHLRVLSTGTQASIDSYTDNGVRAMNYTGHSKSLLTWNTGGSVGPIQQEFHYGISSNGWRIRNKTDSNTWSSWGYVVMTNSNQGAISGTVWHSANDGSGSGLDADTLDGYQANAFPLASGTNTWGNNGINYFRVERGGYSGSINTANLQAYTTGSNSAFMSFHRSGSYAVNMGLDADNVLRIGGWSASANRWVLDMSGNMTAAGNVTAYSDIRLKENIEVIPNALEKVNQIRGVTFTRNDQDDKEARHTGVIAQEVEKVLPEVISEDNLGIKNVAYGNMVGLLIEAVKELKQEVDDLKAQLKEK